jgi:hypothetical protein
VPYAVRPPMPRAIARRIDRLARGAHRFHRFAHHPLCDRYAGEVVRLGRRTRLCRGCTLAAIGGLVGAGAGLWIGAAPTAALGALGAGAALLVPTLASRRRWPKAVTRLAPAALFALAWTSAVLARAWLVAGLAMAVVGGLRVLYGRRGGDRSPCQACPERTASPCSGFAPIVRREQAMQRVVRRWLA